MLILNNHRAGAFIGIDTFRPWRFYGLRFKVTAGEIITRCVGPIKDQFDKIEHIKR